MNDYVIITDTGSDLSPSMAQELGITVVPLKVIANGETIDVFSGGQAKYETYAKDLYKRLRSGEKCTTAAVNVGEFLDVIEPFIKDGKDVLCIMFSSALSNTFNASDLAIKELSEKYPERKIYTVDSLCASLGEGMLVYNAVMKKRSGMSVDKLRDWVEEMKLKICHWFTVDDLMFLKRGGRISSAAAFLGTKLGIKPLMHVDDGGHLAPVGKVRGRKNSLEELAEKTLAKAIDAKDQTMFISHGDCEDEANWLASYLKEKGGVKEVIINYVGPVIGAHSGPGTMALFSFGSSR